MRIAVVGAGIGGLTAAAVLARGHDVTVYERSPGPEAVGAGLVLAPNAARALESVGLDLAAVAEPITRAEIRRADAAVLQQLDLVALARTFGPTFGVSRPVLHAALTGLVADRVRIRYGSSAVVVGHEDPVVDDGADGGERYDLVVGADGIRSGVRSGLGLDRPLRYSGQTCWRGIVVGWPVEGTTEYWGPGVRVGLVPVEDGCTYYWLAADAPAGAPGPGDIDGLRRRFAGFAGEAGELLDRLEALPEHHHDLFELDRPTWGRARVVLLGDAAHAMTPNLGQGAAMAVEDALALGRTLDAGADGLLDRYRDVRQRRVRTVQLGSRRAGWGAQLRGSAVRAVRDALVRSAPASMGRRQYRRLVEPGLRLVA